MENSPLNKVIPLEQAISRHLNYATLAESDGFLLTSIMDRIQAQQEIKALKPKAWTAAALFLGSLVLLAAALNTSWQAFGHSQTIKYFSLIFTDFKTVVDNWQDYVFSVLETLPLGAIMFLLGSAVVSMFLIDFSAKQLNLFRKLTHAQHLPR